MSTSIRIGRLTLNMGSVSHAVGYNANTFQTYIRYAVYQSTFNKG